MPRILGLVTDLIFGVKIASTANSQAGFRTVQWSASNSTDDWAPTIANDADTVVLDDVTSGITALGPVGPNALGLFTPQDPNYLAQTNGGVIPSVQSSLSCPARWRALPSLLPSRSGSGHLELAMVPPEADSICWRSESVQESSCRCRSE